MSEKLTKEQLKAMNPDTVITLFLSLQDRIETLTQSVNKLTEQLAAQNNYRFGRRSEKFIIPDNQMNIFDFLNEAEAVHQDCPNPEEPAAEEVITYRRKKRKGKREQDFKDLPVKTIDHELTNEELQETFGSKWKSLPDQVYRRLHFEPAQFYIEEHHVKVYASCDDSSIVKAKHPALLLKNSMISPSLAAGIMAEKYVKAVPLYRYEQELKRNGIPLSREVMANWMIQMADRYLGVLYDWLHQKLYSYHILQADETPVLVTRDGRHAGSKSYMWVYRTGAMYTDQSIVLYEYQKTRKADHPRKFLKEFKGVLVTDGYQVYHKLANERQDLKISGCWSHARRRFSEAYKAAGEKTTSVAALALAKIQQMYKLEQGLADLTPEDRLKQRQEKLKPLVEAFFAWLKDFNSTGAISPKTKTGIGFAYCLHQEPYLRYFLEDGSVPMDNNAAERTIRPFCIGKKNWVMIDTVNGANASAIIYSIAETAKANHLNPFRYFEYLLTEIPEHMEDKNLNFLEDLAPWSENLPDICRQQIK